MSDSKPKSMQETGEDEGYISYSGSFGSSSSSGSDSGKSYSSSSDSSSGSSMGRSSLIPTGVRDYSSTCSSGYGSGGSGGSGGTYTSSYSSARSARSSRLAALTQTEPVDTSKHWPGTVVTFLQHYLSLIPWLKWEPVENIRDKLSPDLLNESRQLLWDNKEDPDGEFEALNAARDGDELVVAFAVFVAVNHKQLNTMNSDRQTVLHIAAETCSASLCRLVITRGADGAIADVWGDTPLHIASRLGRADVIKALTTTLTKPEVRHPYFRVPYKSLPQDNVQSYNHDGRAPVHLAAQEASSPEHHDALKALARHARADLDYRRLGDGYAPSHIAIDNGDVDCLRICLEQGADSEVRNFKSETPQQLAFLCERKDMVNLCQKYGAGEYQLDLAETEPVPYEPCEEDYDMDTEESDDEELGAMGAVGGAPALYFGSEYLSERMQQMVVTT